MPPTESTAAVISAMSDLHHHPLPVGWAVSLRRGLDTIAELGAAAEVHLLQLSYLRELDDAAGIAAIRDTCARMAAPICAITFGFEGEDWSDVPAIYRTCGLAPASTRLQRMDVFRRIAAFAGKLDVRRLAGHVGHLPERSADEDSLVADVRTLCDELAPHGQVLSMETGQEPADRMLRFIQAVDRPNLAVNFDPANFILYANGDPGAAWDTLHPWVDAIHCKDATPPTDPRFLGTEVRLGEGAIGFEPWLIRVLDHGFCGPLVIETGVKGEQLATDLPRARRLIHRIALEQAVREVT